jgi:enoyl-CoA hydratase
MAAFSYDFAHILVERPKPGVVLFTLNRPERMNATNAALHTELAALPRRLDQDDEARVGVITGAGRAFSVGGDYDDVADLSYEARARMMWETIDLVSGMVEARKPMVSAINGPAAGAGLAVALLADISVANEAANLSDGHARIGLAAGDHAALIWPLLCGMAKAKRYLLTADKITGREAERIGLVSECAPADEVLPRALAFAEQLAGLSPMAVQLSKRALNGWLRTAMPSFDASLGYEMVTAFAPDLAADVARGSGR